MLRILTAFLLVIAQFSWAACDDNLPATGSRHDVLIVVNDNAVDSCEVGRYYAERRNLGRSNILHVKTPANPTISYAQYEILRNQIQRSLQQRTGAAVATCPVSGDTTCAAAIALLSTSPIKYLVLTKGVPARLVKVAGEKWPNAINEAGSVDGYLRSEMGSVFYPARIDGLDLAAAKRLVDRALAAEGSGWRGTLQSVASKTDAGGGPTSSRFAKSDYTPDPVVPVQSEKLVFAIPSSGAYSGDSGIYSQTGSFHWRYQFGLFGETDTACTGNITAGRSSDFYLNNPATSSGGKAPAKCRVELTMGNGAGRGISDAAPGFDDGRIPRAVDTVAYLGHLDNQATFNGNFDVVKNWTRNGLCTARLCKDDTDPAACRAASTDTFRELDTRCIGVADGFIGHNFQSWPLSFFTSWPTGWRPLELGLNTADAGSADRLASEISGSYQVFFAYPRIHDNDGDGDSTSLWFGAHDKRATTACYAVDLKTVAPCKDINHFQFGQKVAEVDTTSISGTQYYRVNISYRSIAGETANGAPSKLAASLVVDDTSVTPGVRKPLRSKLNPALGFAVFRDSSGDVVIGANSGTKWKHASAVFKLDPAVTLGGARKQIGGMALNIFSTENFSGAIGVDSITLEKIDDSDVVKGSLKLTNGNFNDGHSQFAIGDWAATFTSRLNGAAFWGSTTHNCGGTAIFRRLTDTLASFVGGDELAAAVWKNETCSGGLLYGDPLYSPVAVRLNALPQRIAFDTGLALTGSVFNGSGSGIDTRYSVHFCYGKDFFTCDRTADTSWHATNIVEAPGQPQGRNIALGTLDTSAIERDRPFILRLTVRSTKGGKDTIYNDFSQPLTGFDSTGGRGRSSVAEFVR